MFIQMNKHVWGVSESKYYLQTCSSTYFSVMRRNSIGTKKLLAGWYCTAVQQPSEISAKTWITGGSSSNDGRSHTFFGGTGQHGMMRNISRRTRRHGRLFSKRNCGGTRGLRLCDRAALLTACSRIGTRRGTCYVQEHFFYHIVHIADIRKCPAFAQLCQWQSTLP